MSAPDTQQGQYAAWLAQRAWHGEVQSRRPVGRHGAWWVQTTAGAGLIVDLMAHPIEDRHVESARRLDMIEVIGGTPWWVAGQDGQLYAPLLASGALRSDYARLLTAADRVRFLDCDDGWLHCRHALERWYPEYLHALDTLAETAETDPAVAAYEMRVRLLMLGRPVAVGARHTGEQMTVVFGTADGTESTYLMDRAVYDAIPRGTVAAPNDYALFGAIQRTS